MKHGKISIGALLRRSSVIFGSLLVLVLPGPARGEIVDRIVAVVNDEVVTSHQLNQEMARRQPPAEQGQADRDSLRRQTLEELIEEALIRQRAADLGIKVGESELEAAIEDVLKQNRLRREQLEEALAAQGMTLESYRENLRQQILRFKVIGRQVQSRVDVTSEEIGEYYRSHPEEFQQDPSFRLSRLTFPIPERATPAQEEQIGRRAAEALEKLRRGEDFDAVLLRYSGEGTAEGGDLGTFEPGELTTAFDEAVAGLKAGEFTGVVRTPAGFHILLVTERDSSGLLPLEAVRDRIEKTLLEQKTDERLRQWTQELRQDAYIDIRL